MNEFKAYTQPVIGGGYKAMLRKAGDGDAYPILGKGGTVEVYPTNEAALKALLLHLVRYFNGHLVRDGEVAGRTMSKAEALFKPVVKQKGKSRVITVSYKGRGRGTCRRE